MAMQKIHEKAVYMLGMLRGVDGGLFCARIQKFEVAKDKFIIFCFF